jgi:hypothetical protein
VTSVSTFDAMPSIPGVKIQSIMGVFGDFAIRQHARAVQRICRGVGQFDKRASDPY